MTDRQQEMCFVIALYGVTPRDDDLQLLAEVRALFGDAGLETSHLGVDAPGFGNKLLRFPRAWKRLHKAALERVDVVSLHAMEDGWQNTRQWQAQCHLERDDASFVLCARLACMPDAIERMLAFALDRLGRMRPGYGIGYLRPRDRGPYLYAMGVGYSHWYGPYEGMIYEENRLASRWLQGMSDAVYQQGVLRDVYPYNLLTPRHLERDVGGMALGAWIRERAWRGRIAEHPHQYALWTVDPKHLLDVRRALAARHGLYVMGPDNHLERLLGEREEEIVCDAMELTR